MTRAWRTPRRRLRRRPAAASRQACRPPPPGSSRAAARRAVGTTETRRARLKRGTARVVQRVPASRNRSACAPRNRQCSRSWQSSLRRSESSSEPPVTSSGLDAPQRSDERVDVLAGVVERERWADNGLDAEAAQDRLGAVVARAHGDALLVERGADVLGAEAVEDERHDARLLARGADEAQAGDGEEPRGRVFEERVLVGGRGLDADRL